MSLSFLEPLEDQIREAADRLRELGRENAELRDRVASLEARLEAASTEEAAAWKGEKEEVRRRVAAMVERLEALAALGD